MGGQLTRPAPAGALGPVEVAACTADPAAAAAHLDRLDLAGLGSLVG